MRLDVFGAPPGFDALVLADLATSLARPLLFIARDDVRLSAMQENLAFFAPRIESLAYPAWDCLPYDRVSPNPEIVSRRIDTLTRLLAPPAKERARVVLATVSAVVQRTMPRRALAAASLTLRRGGQADPAKLIEHLGRHGYARVETVTEPGDFAVRGGIIDVFPSGAASPARLDFFGDELGSIRLFDTASQRSRGEADVLSLQPISEVLLDEDSIARFRSGYRAQFGAVAGEDTLYESISAGRRHPGCEHWLPLFHDRLETIFDYQPDGIVVLDHQAEQVRDERFEMIADYFGARRDFDRGRFAMTASAYKAVPPEHLYLDAGAWDRHLAAYALAAFSPYAMPPESAQAWDAGGRPGLDFAEARTRPEVNVFDELGKRIAAHHQAGQAVMIAAASRGSRERLASVLKEHGLARVSTVERWSEAREQGRRGTTLATLALDRGFATPDFAVIAEQDILGERLIRRRSSGARPETLLREASALDAGDLVVHVEHGIGRYEGLETIAVDGAPHDCLRIVYAGGDKLYLPVENIEMVTRYGSQTEGVVLDRLGGAAWQSRKAKLKQRIREMAAGLIQLAAARMLRQAPVIETAQGIFDEFCARFPYAETDDQARAIADVLGDLAGGKPADRLICGDVGFGKTEVALRAAFVAVMEGKQVAVVVPTTLLCRQHYKTFLERFAGFPVRIAELSRMVPPKQVRQAKAGLADGTIDIAIGTHALLAKDLKFRDLGLLVVDEEQHFGVVHKEQLKKLKTDVHVLTLTATPIPRTLQMALTGVREMSLIATPPIDRLAVRTFVLEFDPVVIREAILRERHRGGQTFYVCPRIEDLEQVGKDLRALVPEVKVITAHGRMPVRDLEAAVGAFYEGAYDVLLSTNIIESGLDLPAANTIIAHRADMFGLSQLYQLRGRVGRAKVRAYAYLTLPAKGKVTAAAQKRLSVMQSLDALGAGFTLASHDLDIRGAGNLLGDEQSGHIREVGIELYQQMLEDAVAEARGAPDDAQGHDEWSPQLTIGISVLIPEAFVPDLGVRLGLYRRLADLRDEREIEAFAAELIDRFGALPEEVENLLQVVAVKQLCRRAGVERVECGPKGALITFRNNTHANPAGLVTLINRRIEAFKLRPDQKLLFRSRWETPAARLRGARSLLTELAKLAAGGGA